MDDAPVEYRREVGVSRPLLLAVEDDAERFPLLQRELRNRYSVDYEVLCLPTSQEALRTLDEAGSAGHEVALVLALAAERVRRASIGLALLARSAPGLAASPTGKR